MEEGREGGREAGRKGGKQTRWVMWVGGYLDAVDIILGLQT